MTFTVAPSRKPAFWAEIDRLNKVATKAAKAPVEPIDVHTKPAKAQPKTPDVHKKSGKVHTTAKKPAAKKPAKPARAKAGKTRRR